MEMIATSKSIQFELNKIALACIDVIKANLERLGWLDQHDEREMPRISFKVNRNLSIEDLFLQKQEAFAVHYHLGFRQTKSLSDMLDDEIIDTNELLSLLQLIEKIN